MWSLADVKPFQHKNAHRSRHSSYCKTIRTMLSTVGVKTIKKKSCTPEQTGVDATPNDKHLVEYEKRPHPFRPSLPKNRVRLSAHTLTNVPNSTIEERQRSRQGSWSTSTSRSRSRSRTRSIQPRSRPRSRSCQSQGQVEVNAKVKAGQRDVRSRHVLRKG